MGPTIRLYHNPRCTKSRQAKKILDEKELDYETVLYLDDPPSLEQLQHIAKWVQGGAAAMLRLQDARAAGWDEQAGHDEKKILEFIVEHPHVLQRPILVRGDEAVVGRPPERIERLL